MKTLIILLVFVLLSWCINNTNNESKESKEIKEDKIEFIDIGKTEFDWNIVWSWTLKWF